MVAFFSSLIDWLVICMKALRASSIVVVKKRLALEWVLGVPELAELNDHEIRWGY